MRQSTCRYFLRVVRSEQKSQRNRDNSHELIKWRVFYSSQLYIGFCLKFQCQKCNLYIDRGIIYINTKDDLILESIQTTLFFSRWCCWCPRIMWLHANRLALYLNAILGASSIDEFSFLFVVCMNSSFVIVAFLFVSFFRWSDFIGCLFCA